MCIVQASKFSRCAEGEYDKGKKTHVGSQEAGYKFQKWSWLGCPVTHNHR